MNIAVVGSREWEDADAIHEALDKLERKYPNSLVIISGGCRGVDTIAEEWARRKGVPVEVYHAEWGKYGKSAGPRRNDLIIDDSDALLAFWDGKSRGTLDSITKAKQRGIPVKVVTKD